MGMGGGGSRVFSYDMRIWNTTLPLHHPHPDVHFTHPHLDSIQGLPEPFIRILVPRVKVTPQRTAEQYGVLK